MEKFEKDWLKANRKGSRDAELETTNTGWSAKTKKHSTLKDYSRKGKKKFRGDIIEDDVEELEFY